MEDRLQLFLCMQCCNETQHVILGTFEDAHYDEDGLRIGLMGIVLAKCTTCERASVYVIEENNAISVWPNSSLMGDGVPLRVYELYQEAASVKARSARSFAVLIRCALEAICADRACNGTNLMQRLDTLVSQCELPPIAKNLAHVLRTLGNKGAHDTESDISAEEAHMLDWFFLALVEYVYVAPAKLQQYESALAHLRNIAGE